MVVQTPNLVFTHAQRLEVAAQLKAQILAQHGRNVAAIVVFGSTAAGTDGPYSDLDLTVVTYADSGGNSKCYPYCGLQINLDYQTVEESFDEAREPHGGGCWLTCLSLYDPAQFVPQFASAYRTIGQEACQQAFVHVVRDDLSVYIGKARNAALCADRASLIAACSAFSVAACRALCMLNGNREVAGNSRLIAVAKGLPILPPRFAENIALASGAEPAGDQAIYEALEALWAGICQISDELRLCRNETDLLI